MGKNKIFDEAKKILSENHNLLQLEVQSNISKAKSDDEFSTLNAKKRELIFFETVPPNAERRKALPFLSAEVFVVWGTQT